MANYSFFLGQGGGNGGGGDGGYAIIKIEYPSGSQVTVTHGGNTVNAPDTSGVWVYGCEEGGTYTISLAGTTVSKSVSITTKGQIEFVYVSPQVINYALIYHLGDEFTNVAGTAKAQYAISTGGWEYSVPVFDAFGTTLLNIDTGNFKKMFSYVKKTADWTSKNYLNLELGYGGWNKDSRNNTHLNNILATKLYEATNGETIKDFLLQDDIISGALNTPMQIVMGVDIDSSTSWSFSIEKKTNCFYYEGIFAKYGHNRGYLYSIGFVRQDSLTGLSKYGNNIDAILNNATTLFTDTSALQWMVTNCTGDFMISALNNDNFKNAMNTSPNKSILVANEHWNRFIALLSL